MPNSPSRTPSPGPSTPSNSFPHRRPLIPSIFDRPPGLGALLQPQSSSSDLSQISTPVRGRRPRDRTPPSNRNRPSPKRLQLDAAEVAREKFDTLCRALELDSERVWTDAGALAVEVYRIEQQANKTNEDRDTIQRLSRTVTDTQGIADGLKERIAELEKNKTDLEDQLLAHKDEGAGHEGEIQSLQRQLANLSKSDAAAATEIARLKHSLQHATQQRDSIVKERNASITDVSGKLKIAETELGRARKDLAATQKDLEKGRADLNAARTIIAAEQKSTRDAQAALAKVQAEADAFVAHLRAEYETKLRALFDNAGSTSATIGTELEAASALREAAQKDRERHNEDGKQGTRTLDDEVKQIAELKTAAQEDASAALSARQAADAELAACIQLRKELEQSLKDVKGDVNQVREAKSAIQGVQAEVVQIKSHTETLQAAIETTRQAADHLLQSTRSACYDARNVFIMLLIGLAAMFNQGAALLTSIGGARDRARLSATAIDQITLQVQQAATRAIEDIDDTAVDATLQLEGSTETYIRECQQAASQAGRFVHEARVAKEDIVESARAVSQSRDKVDGAVGRVHDALGMIRGVKAVVEQAVKRGEETLSVRSDKEEQRLRAAESGLTKFMDALASEEKRWVDTNKLHEDTEAKMRSDVDSFKTDCLMSVKTITDSVQHHRNQANQLQSTVDTLSSTSTALSDAHKQLTNSTAELKRSHQRLWEGIAPIDNVRRNLSTDMPKFQERANKISTYLKEVGETLSTLETRYEEIKLDDKTLSAQVSVLQKGRDEAGNKTEWLVGIDQLATRLSELEGLGGSVKGMQQELGDDGRVGRLVKEYEKGSDPETGKTWMARIGYAINKVTRAQKEDMEKLEPRVTALEAAAEQTPPPPPAALSSTFAPPAHSLPASSQQRSSGPALPAPHPLAHIPASAPHVTVNVPGTAGSRSGFGTSVPIAAIPTTYADATAGRSTTASAQPGSSAIRPSQDIDSTSASAQAPDSDAEMVQEVAPATTRGLKRTEAYADVFDQRWSTINLTPSYVRECTWLRLHPELLEDHGIVAEYGAAEELVDEMTATIEPAGARQRDKDARDRKYKARAKELMEAYLPKLAQPALCRARAIAFLWTFGRRMYEADDDERRRMLQIAKDQLNRVAALRLPQEYSFKVDTSLAAL